MDKVSNTIAAIDIGTTKIVAITGNKKEDGRYEITGFGTAPSIGIKRGVVLNIEHTINSINAAIDNAEINLDDLESVYVGVAGQHIRSLKNRGKLDLSEDNVRIRQEHLDELTEKMYETEIEPGEEILHVIPQNYIVDKESGVENPIGMFADLLQVNAHIVIGQKALLNNIKNCLDYINLDVKALILEPLASAQAVLTEEEKDLGVALIDIGGGTTDIAVFKNKTLIHSAVIPIGGNTITKDIKQTFSLLDKQAEELKIQYGSALADKSQKDLIITIEGLKGRDPKEFSLNDLCQIIKARMEEIIHAVMFQIESSKFQGQLNAGIVITGGGSLLKNLKQLVSFISGYDVRIAYPNEYISGKFAETINKPQFSTAIGLIMKGHEYSVSEQEKIIKKINEASEEDENSKKKKKEKIKKESKLMDIFRNSMTKLFDEDDEFEK